MTKHWSDGLALTNEEYLTAFGRPRGTTVELSCNEWYNLLNALRTIIERYGWEAVKEALDHVQATGQY